MKIKLLFVPVTAFLIFAGCSKSSQTTPTAPGATAPVISITTAASIITTTSATSGGNVTSDGGASVTARGVCWNISSNPTIANSKTVDGSGTGAFTSNLTGLTAGTVYYIRAYATNSAGTSYAPEVSFTTGLALALPVHGATVAASNITTSTAVSGGNVLSDGGAAVTARGVCWSTTSNPTTANSKTIDGTGTGTFASNLIGLTANTVYYVRAYATNSLGTSYGSEVSFTSAQTGTVIICSQVWKDKNLSVSNYRNGDPIPLVTNMSTWMSLTTGAYCYYNDDPATEAIYGKLYNWYAINDPRGLAPTGWHVPTTAEWSTLSSCLGGGLVAGGALKEPGFTHWVSPNTGATNSSGFTALGGGARTNGGTYFGLYNETYWWTSSQGASPGSAWGRSVTKDDAGIVALGSLKQWGQYVRCVKD